MCYLYLNEKLLIIEHQTTFQFKEINLSLSVVTKINLSLWPTKLDPCVESVCVWSFFLVQIFSHIPTEYGDLQSKSPYSLTMRRNLNQTNSDCEHLYTFHTVDVRTLQRYFDNIVF